MRGRPPIGDAGALRSAMDRAAKRQAPVVLPLEKAIFYGPKGGKWADAAHTIPYKEGTGRRKGAKEEPKGRRQSGVQEIPKGRKKGQEEPSKGRQKAAPEGPAGREKSSPEDNGKRPPGSESAPSGRDKAQEEPGKKPKGGEDAKQAPTAREWVKGADYGLKETDKQHKGADGEYTPVRKKLHEEIYAKFLDHVPTVPENQKPTAIVTMGGPAAGKTTLVKHVQSNFNDFAVVNPDDVKEELPEYKKGINLGEKDGKTVSARDAAFLVHQESSDVAQDIQKLAIEQRKNIILDGTGKNVEKYRKKIADLKAAGYHVQVIMPHVDMNEAIDRVETRAEKTGRYVPEDIVRHAHTRIPSNFEAIARTADEFALFKSGRPPKSVWSGGAGKGDVVHDPNYVRDFLRLGKRLTQEVESGMHKSENGEGGDKKPPSVSLDDLVKRVASFDAPEEDKDAEQIQGGDGDGIWWPIEDYEDEIREKMDKEGGPVKKSFTVPAKRFIVKGLYIGPRGGKWADAKHTIPYKDESATAHNKRFKEKNKQHTFDFSEPKGFPWKRFQERAKGMSQAQLEGAIKDAQDTLQHADAMDRETGADRGGHYRDEISVYRKELATRKKVSQKLAEGARPVVPKELTRDEQKIKDEVRRVMSKPDPRDQDTVTTGTERVGMPDGSSIFIKRSPDRRPVSSDPVSAGDVVAGKGPYKPGDALQPTHNSPETAYVIDDYPYGRDRTEMRVWVETDKKGKQRIARQTLNPKTNRWNKPKKSTYSDALVAKLDENGHVKTHTLNVAYDREGQIPKFLEAYGGHMDPKQLATAVAVHTYDVATKRMGKTRGEAMKMAEQAEKQFAPKGEEKPKKKASKRTRYNEALTHENDPMGYSKQLTSDVKKVLKKELGVTSIKQGYKGTGSQAHRKQLWVRFGNGQGIDLFLDGETVRLGGVQRSGFGKVDTKGRSSYAVASEIAGKLKPLNEAGEWD